jgi:hypothetical protein
MVYCAAGSSDRTNAAGMPRHILIRGQWLEVELRFPQVPPAQKVAHCFRHHQTRHYEV